MERTAPSVGRRFKTERSNTAKNLHRRLRLETARQKSSRQHLPLGKRYFKFVCSATRRVAIAYTKSKPWMLALAIATLASCIFYVVGTYMDMGIVIWVEIAFAIIFFVDWVLSMIAAPVAFSYVFSVEGLIDLCSILPVFGGFKRWMYSLSFIRYLRLIKAIRIVRSHELMGIICRADDASYKAGLLGIKVAGLILMTTAIIYGTEQAVHEDTETGAFNEGDEMQWHDALYFTIVTLSTVGYGDVLPVQTFSRMLMVVVILIALTYVPLEVGHLVDVISQRPKHRKGFPKSLVGDHLHVVIAMVGTDGDEKGGFDADLLGRLLDELFHEDHAMDSERFWIVVLAPCPPSTEVQALLRSPRFQSRVIYYRGSVMNPRDMDAVSAEYADCIFLYPETDVLEDSKQSEERTTLAAKALQRYLDRTPTDPELVSKVERLSIMGTTCRTVVTVRELSSKDQLLRFGIDHVICHDELKMAMLACGTLCPAFLPFVINALRSSAPPEDGSVDSSAHVASGDGESDVVAENWLDDYTRGMQYEVYSLPFNVPQSSSLDGMSFSRAALSLYEVSGGEVLLVAVVREHCKDDGVSGSTSESTARNVGARASSGTTQGEPEAIDPRSPVLNTPVINPTDVTLHNKNTRRSKNRHNKRTSALGSVFGSFDTSAFRRRHRADTLGKENMTSYIHTAIFPTEDFTFTELCYVMVLAKDKKKAEDHILALQEMTIGLNVGEESGSATGSSTDVRFTTRVVGAERGDAADAVERGTINPVHVKSEGAVGVEMGSSGVVGTDIVSSPGSTSSSVTSWADATASGRTRRLPSVRAMPETEEERAELESVRQQIRQEEGVGWKDALQALKEATDVLKDLEAQESENGAITEAVVARDPVHFFGKVELAATNISKALKGHTSHLPEGLEGHLILVGSHPRLQHYVLALRRQQPHVPIVIVTQDEQMFFSLRERLVQSKWREPSLDISRIYHVFGHTKDTSTFMEAKIHEADSVVLMSDQPDDSDVLLVSFELEQLLGQMELGESTPKVLIDLRKDSSIYYCGHNLSRGGPGISTSHMEDDRGQLQELAMEVAFADVWEWPLFAAGRVWTETIMDVVAVQTYFSVEILAFFETLLQIRRPVLLGNHLVDVSSAVFSSLRKQVLDEATEGQPEAGAAPAAGGEATGADARKSPVRQLLRDNSVAASALQRGQFDQLKVSHYFKGKKYADLVKSLLLRGAMPIGLYRPAGTKGSTLPYTHVNPSPTEPLIAWPRMRERDWSKMGPRAQIEGDSVFVIRSRTCRVFDST